MLFLLVKTPYVGPMKAHAEVPVAHEQAFLGKHPEETSGESTAMLLQKENLYVVKGSAGMKDTYEI